MASRLCDTAATAPGADPDDGPRAPAGGASSPIPIGSVALAGFPGEIDVLELTGRPTEVEHTDTGELWTRSPFI